MATINGVDSSSNLSSIVSTLKTQGIHLLLDIIQNQEMQKELQLPNLHQ